MAHHVFVSHSVKDKATAERIVAHLERDGIQCWVAPRDVMPGADWGESIINAIESSRVMVLIFSAHANGSSQIKREVERAVDKDVYIIPFRIDDIEPTRSLEYFISTSQWMDAFPPPLEPHLEKLSRTIKAIAAKPAAVAAATPTLEPEPTAIPVATSSMPTATPVDSAPAWLKAVAIGAGFVVLCLGVWYMARQGASLPEEKGKDFDARHGVASAAPVAVPVETPPLKFGTEITQATKQPNVAKQATPKGEMLQELMGTSSPSETLKNAANSLAPSYSKGDVTPEDPATVVRRYYESINRRDPTQAYDYFAQGFKGRRSYDEFAQNFAATRSITLRQADETKRTETEADVAVAFTEVDAENHTREWEGHVLLVKEGGAWRINQMPVKQRTVAPTKKY